MIMMPDKKASPPPPASGDLPAEPVESDSALMPPPPAPGAKDLTQDPLAEMLAQQQELGGMEEEFRPASEGRDFFLSFSLECDCSLIFVTYCSLPFLQHKVCVIMIY